LDAPWILQPRKQGQALLLIVAPSSEPLSDGINPPANLILDIPFQVTRF